MCYPSGTDWSCFDGDVDALDPTIKARSEALAWNALSALLGYRLSICPVTIRPCALRFRPGTWDEAALGGAGSYFQPYMGVDGNWYNACGCTGNDCSCMTLPQVTMPAPVGGIVSVTVDGVVLAPTAYRVVNGRTLIRTDGGVWPVSQDFTAAPDAAGAFSISYYPNLAPNEMTRYAAGVLANEFYLACSGQRCRLPDTVTSITRAGLSVDVPGGLFPDGASGIREVDTVIRMYNPNGLKVPPRVMSPDRRGARSVY